MTGLAETRAAFQAQFADKVTTDARAITHATLNGQEWLATIILGGDIAKIGEWVDNAVDSGLLNRDDLDYQDDTIFLDTPAGLVNFAPADEFAAVEQ